MNSNEINNKKVRISSRYQQVFQIANLAVLPDVLGLRHNFKFEEKYNISIIIPDGKDEVTIKEQEEINPFRSYAIPISSKDNKPSKYYIYSVVLTIDGLDFDIPYGASIDKNQKDSYFDENETNFFNNEADKLYLCADRAINYWLRVVIWKKRGYSIALNRFGRSIIDGGHLFNNEINSSFYSPLISRTISIRPWHTLTRDDFVEIDCALINGKNPPVWHEYIASAEQKLVHGDLNSAFINLAISLESIIRNYIDRKLPSDISDGVREILRKQNIGYIVDNSEKLSMPKIFNKSEIKNIIAERNNLMHGGCSPSLDRDFVENSYWCVRKLIILLENIE